MNARPPALLRRLLSSALPPEVRDGIVGDLEEVYAARRSRRGAWRAGLWYAGQVVAISARFAGERVVETLSVRGLSLGPDLKLGFRMLLKYPMLTLVGGAAITIATGIGVGTSEFVRDMLTPDLPLPEGDRIVRLHHSDGASGRGVPASLYDLEVWRESIASLQDVGAYTTREQGLVTDRGERGTVSLARVTASTLQLTGVPPLLGRPLLAADEEPGAPDVVVVGYDVWQTLLDGESEAVGRTVRLGGTPTTVVGVMPEGYGFPQVQNAWAPLRADPADLQPTSAPRVGVVARLAPGATLESARAEVEVAGRRAAADHPEVYGRLTPEVVPFSRRASTVQATMALSAVRLLLVFLLVVACANVATLVFARTVMREGEIAVRTALGASRRRIVLQLLAEALVLVGGATLLGLVLARWALERIARLFFVIQQEPRLPFWWDHALSPTTIAYALLLALVGAVMVGVVPALKATAGPVRPNAAHVSSGGGGRLRFGGGWTLVIVLQVALSVAFLPLAVSQAGAAFQHGERTDFPATRYVTAQLGRDAVVPPRTEAEEEAWIASSRRLFEETRDRVAADPAVEGAALASGLSGMNHIRTPLEFVGAQGSPPVTGFARVLLVDGSYLDLMGATPVAGQTLGPADFSSGSRRVVVNEAFVEELLEGRNPVGGRLRFPERTGESSVVQVPESGTTVEVVGVVRNPGIDAFGPGTHPVIYAPLDLAPVEPRAAGLVGMPEPPATQLFVRVRPEAEALASRLYPLVASVDPTLRVSSVGTAEEAWASVHTGARLGAWIFMAVAGVVLLLSVAGIYALMSFTVTRRTKEIAIRTAVGAGRGEIVGTVFGRAALQLLIGALLGALVAVPVLWDGVADEGPRTLLIVAGLLLSAGLAACLLPVRRALAIEPAAAMKAE